MRLRAAAVGMALAVLIVRPLPAQIIEPSLLLFFQAASPDRATSEQALEKIGAQWKDGYAALLLDWVRFLPAGDAADNVHTARRIVEFLEAQTGRRYGDDLDGWRRWMWAQPYDTHSQISTFKANVYGSVDQAFRGFFKGTAAVRLDEIDWGGVRVGGGGIPALDHPPTVAAAQAGYLADDNIVFGLSVNGHARAYPKRILAWHELAWDTVGEVEITLVYCTLCGVVIPYRSEVDGQLVKLNTSGLLYRSNKLLFDEPSMTLWSSITGEPLVGELVGSDVRLTPLPVVTTTWRDWRTANPYTTVLSLETGFDRDYGEGVAYADYFATDELMFEVPSRDSRLNNKDEVLAVRFPGPDGDEALAISAEFLRRNRLFQTSFAGRELLVVTSEDGANRLYASPPAKLVRFVEGNRIEDASGKLWEAREDQLVPLEAPAEALPRITAFRAFWFGWYAQYPRTELIAG